MEFTNISLNIGLNRPLRFLHITDSHLTFADERDDMRKRELAATRTRDFHDVMHEPGEALARLEEAITYAREHCDLLVHTGDVIDFVSHPNFELLQHLLHATDTIFAAGNHEFSIYIGEAKEDDAYKARHFKAVRELKKRCPWIRIVGSGATCLQEFLPNAAEYAVSRNETDFVGIGRMVLSYPDFCADSLSGAVLDRRRICRTFGDCTNAPRNGMISGCYPLDHFYRQLPEAQKLKNIKMQAKK